VASHPWLDKHDPEKHKRPPALQRIWCGRPERRAAFPRWKKVTRAQSRITDRRKAVMRIEWQKLS
jgi:hypothetical protein